MKLDVNIQRYPGNIYIAVCRNIKGCYAQGNSEEEAVKRIRETVQLMINSYRQHFEKVPFHE